MTPAGPDTNNPHAPRSVSESSVITCEHDVNDVDADYQVFSEPIVQVDGELNLTGGWVLRKHVSPKGGDTISIFPERQKGTRANLAESIEKHMNSDETLPRYKGWVYVLEGDKNSIDPVETSTIRGDRLRERQNEGIILRRRGKQTAFVTGLLEALTRPLRNLGVSTGKRSSTVLRYVSALDLHCLPEPIFYCKHRPQFILESSREMSSRHFRWSHATERPKERARRPRRQDRCANSGKDLQYESACWTKCNFGQAQICRLQSSQRMCRRSHASDLLSDHSEGEEEVDELT